MKPHYRRGLKNWEEKKKHQFNSIIQTRFFVKGDGKIPSYFKTTWKPQTPKKFQLPKRIRFPRSISQRIRENVPSEIPPLKSHWKMARLIVYSIPKHPTEDSTLNNWGNVQQDFPGVAPPTAKQLHHVVFLLGRNFEVWRFFFVEKECTDSTPNRHICKADSSPWTHSVGLCCSFDAKQKKNILSCIFDFIQSVTLHTSRRSWKIPKKTSHHRKGPKASISHKVSASPLGNTTPTTLPNIVSGQVTMRRAPPGSIRWMWPQRGLFRGSGSKPIRTCVQQWEVVVF